MKRFIVLLVLLCTAAIARADATNTGLTPEQYINGMRKGLGMVGDKLIAPTGPVEIGVNLTFAHEAWIGAFSADTLLKAVDAVAESGAKRLELNMGAFPWLDQDGETIEKYDAVVARARSHNLKIHINPQYSKVRHRFASLSEWEKAATKFYPILAERYKPDTFVVVHEPTTMAARLGAVKSIRKWAGFAERLAKIVKQASPETRTGAGGLPDEKRYFQAFADLDAVEVLTLDIYALKGLKQANQMIKIARRADKPVYIEETGRPPYYAPEPGLSLDQIAMRNVGTAKFEVVDREWARTMTRYAAVQGLEGITFFWAHPLFAYVAEDGHANSPEYNRTVEQAVTRGMRTGTFQVLRKLTRQYSK